MNLVAQATSFGQAPFATARPHAIVHHRGVNGLAHHRFRFDAGVESSEISYAGIESTCLHLSRTIKQRIFFKFAFLKFVFLFLSNYLILEISSCEIPRKNLFISLLSKFSSCNITGYLQFREKIYFTDRNKRQKIEVIFLVN